MNASIAQQYGNKLRTRACGIAIKDDAMLLVKHRGIGKAGTLWLPPGGGMEFGQSAHENLIREIKEETGLDATVEEFLFTFEYMEGPLHSVELFFSVKVSPGQPIVGKDPESADGAQIIQAVEFVTFNRLEVMSKMEQHHIFRLCSHPNEVLNLRGYFKFQNNYLK